MVGQNVKTWTKAQKKAITERGAVLVSAAAGSGKTAVLAERCAYFVCDAPDPCDVNRLLVVTFTKSAAAEMKSRIRQALLDRQQKRPNDTRLKRQIALVEQAHVSTVHGFCARLLRQNFHFVGLDPAFETLDDDEAVLLRREVANDLFQRRYETDKDGRFQGLVDSYGKGDGGDSLLIDEVIDAHALLQSLANPDQWIARVRGELADAAAKPIDQSKLGNDFLKLVAQQLQAFGRQCADAISALVALGPVYSGYVQQVKDLEAVAGHWQTVLNKHGLDMLISEFTDFIAAIPQAPRVASDAPNKALAQSLLASAKDAIKKGPLKELLAFNSAQWQAGMPQTLPSAEMFLSLVEEFGEVYARAKRSERAVDFSDLERLTLKVLTEKPDLVRSLREQFVHVLVDEYQDINEIQDSILELVTRPQERANLFVVGDVKQSIFRFRLADPERFTKRKELSESNVIDLQENFRSREPLLRAINAIFERLMTKAAAEIEYDEKHCLKPGRGFLASDFLPTFKGGPIEFHLLPAKPRGLDSDDESSNDSQNDFDLDRVEYEAMLAARRIESLMGKDGSARMHVQKVDPATGQDALVPIEYGDIVILLRSMKFKGDVFASVLRAHRIPVNNDGGGGFFSSVEVRDMLCLLQVLDNQNQDIPLAAILRSPLADFPQPDDCLARIRLQYPGDDENPIAFHQAVQRYQAEQDDELARRLRSFLQQVSDWRDQANKRPVAELLWTIYEQSGYLTYCAGLADGQQRVANLIYLHERAAQFGTFLRQDLHRFLRFLENIREERDLGRPSTAAGGEQAVRIMTIHGAKGLEFPAVIVPDLGKMHNLSDARGAILLDRKRGLGMDVVDEQRMIRYPSLASTLVAESLLRQSLAEELRLLYVAMTRAREHLILMATCGDKSIEQWNQQWQNHPGPVPADQFLAARNALEWLGTAAALTASANPPVFEITRHNTDDVRLWPVKHYAQEATSPLQETMAALKPLSPVPPASALAESVKQRFQAVYPFKAFSKRTASASVTALAKSASAPGVVESKTNSPTARKLDLPVFYVPAQPKATDIGTATHLALQHWDFSKSASEAQINRKIQELLDQHLMTSAQAQMINRDAIAWFLNHDVGRLLAENHVSLMRETAFALAAAPDGSPPNPAENPMDLVMIRGRIDLLFPHKTGIAIVDYKTDNIRAADVPQRAQAYAGQMRLYRRAIEQIAGKKLSASFLVFLSARTVEEINLG
jgi:ATP-dependent helicase/nuclease subunit A